MYKYIDSSRKNTPFKYYITVTGVAEGGATFTTPNIELDVKCGPSSHSISAPIISNP